MGLDRMCKIFLLVCICTFIFCPVSSKEEKRFGISVFVLDSERMDTQGKKLPSWLAHKSLKDADVTVLDADSTFITRAHPVQIYHGRDFYRFDAYLPAPSTYIIKAEHEGYETAFHTVVMGKNERTKYAGEIYLHKKAIELKEVTVIGTKLLMVNRGDTIVYNASALQLSNGAMLDGLIRRLPGVELHPGGRITVNGNFVESLLVNGRNFFHGDPKVALENLPAYYVDEVKVYNKTSMRRKIIYGDSVKASEREDPYVMDVRLKRDYAEGWLGNVEVGYGTENRYMARLFGMRYTNQTGLFVYGNVNNLNNNQTTGNNGGWKGSIPDEGTLKARTAGVSYSGDNPEKHVEYSSSAKLSVTDGNYENISSTDNYYSTGSTYQRSRLQSGRKNSNVEWEGRMSYGSMGGFMVSIEPHFSYERTEDNSLLRSVSFLANPEEKYRSAAIDSLFSPTGSLRLVSMLINKHEQQTQATTGAFRLGGIVSTSIPVFGKWLDLSFNCQYDNIHRKHHDVHFLEYGATAREPNYKMYQFTEQPNMDYAYSIRLTYDLVKLLKGQLNTRLYYFYHQQYDGGERQLYRLHLPDQYAIASLEQLPSTTDSLQAAIDFKNSYVTSTLQRSHQVIFDFKYRFWQVMLPFSLVNDRIDDYRDGKQCRLTHHKAKFEPRVIYYKDGYFAQYQLQAQLPYIGYLLEVRDDSDPLILILGNSGLGSTAIHQLSVGYKPRRPKGLTTFNAEQNFSLTTDAVSMSRSYNLTTGVTTLRPENINGNWQAWGNISYGKSVGEKRYFRITTTTDYRYHHSVDLSSIDGTAASKRNTVHNLSIGETLKGDFRLHDWNITATTHATWRHATSPTEVFHTVNAWDYNYGMTLTKQMLKNLDLNTELTMWSRRGYTDRSMDEDCLIWNACVTYAFGHLKQWILKVDGVDILHQRSNVRIFLNAQGRTETWYKTIPSYWMLHLMFQFKKPPKKRNT